MIRMTIGHPINAILVISEIESPRISLIRDVLETVTSIYSSFILREL